MAIRPKSQNGSSSPVIEYEDITNIKNNTKINTLGNDASENMQVKMKTGSWINVRKVDFGTTGAEKFTLRAKGTGTVELRFSRAGRPTATFEFSSTEMEDLTFDIDASKFKGVKNNILIAVTAADNFYVDVCSLQRPVLPASAPLKTAYLPRASATT